MTELVTRIPDQTGRHRSEYVYSTSQFIRFELITPLPASVVHAKVVGTSSTMCGVPCGSWRKFLDLPFRDAVGPRCAECSTAAGIRLDHDPLIGADGP